MNCDVEAHKLPEVVILESELICEIGAVVECAVSSGNLAVVAVLVVEDNGCDSRNLCTNVKSILKGRLPVL